MLESVYENALYFDLEAVRIRTVACQVPMPFIYKEVKMEVGYRIDIVVESKVLIEVKSVETLAPVHYAQTLTYLKLSGFEIRPLINFNVKALKESIHRIVNNL